MHKENRVINTIGYQNLQIENFVFILRKRGVRLVVDVRNNPFSFKRGFSKKWLVSNLPKYDIDYINIPELGIPSKFRKEMTGAVLWNKYYEIIEEHNSQLHSVANFIRKKSTVLMCFEADPTDCHRSILADTLSKKFHLEVIHYCQSTNEWMPLKREY